MMSCRPLASLGMTVLMSAQAVRAQSVEGVVGGYMVQSHVLFTNARMEQTGQWLGGEGTLRVGRGRVTLAGAIGSLNGDDDALHPDRKGRSTALIGGIQALPWLALGAGAEARRFDTDVGVTIWRLVGANVRITPALASALEGLVDVTWWPSATAIEGDKISLALRTIIGADYRVANGPVRIRLAYRFERFDFEEQSGSARLEQFRGATLGAVVRLGRSARR